MTEVVTAFEHCDQTLNWHVYLHKTILSLLEASVLLGCDTVLFRCIGPCTSKMLSHQRRSKSSATLQWEPPILHYNSQLVQKLQILYTRGNYTKYCECRLFSNYQLNAQFLYSITIYICYIINSKQRSVKHFIFQLMHTTLKKYKSY